MNPSSRRFPLAAAKLFVMAVLPIAYVAAYVQLGEVHFWQAYGGAKPLHVRSFPSREMAKFFEPLARLESRVSQQTALASKKQPRTGR